MNKKLVISQIINIVGICNLIVILLLGDNIAPTVRKFSLIFSGTLIFCSVIMILWFSFYFLKFIRRLNAQTCSSSASLVFRFIFPNLLLAPILGVFLLGLFYNPDLITVAIFFSVFVFFPVVVLLKSVFVVMKNNELRIYNYTEHSINLDAEHLIGVSRVLPGLLYKIKYHADTGKVKSKYFIPQGVLFNFFHPKSVKLLKDIQRGDGM